MRLSVAKGMHSMKLSRRIAKNSGKSVKTDIFGATKKLVELVERARDNSSEQGPLIPIEALVTVENDEWIWKKVDRKALENLSHRLVLQNSNGFRREILMTSNIDNAMDAASIIVDLDGGCVLIETLEP
tara:strand:- start:14976 stop:15362 length:387 start_codon:yes stop_codon:yes gene_type:complete